MSSVANPPVTPVEPAAPAAAPASPPADPRSSLPASAKITVSSRHDATDFFDAHKAANGAPVKPAAPVAPGEPVKPAVAAVAPVEPTATPSLAQKLAAKTLPATVEPAAAPAVAAALGTNPEDAVVLDKNLSPKAHESFGQMKTITKGLRDQLIISTQRETQLKTELEAAKKGVVGPDAAEVTRLREEHKAMSDRLMLVDLQAHPKFNAEFVAPRDAAVQAAQELLTANGVQGVNVADLLAKPRAEFGKAVSEAAKTLSAFDQTDFAENMRRAYGLKQQGEQALSKSREVYGALRAQTIDGQKKAFESVWGKAWGQFTEHAVESDIPANATPEMRAAIEDYNNSFRGIRQQAERIALGATNESTVAESAIKAAAYDFHIQKVQPRLLAEINHYMGQVQTLTKEIAAIRDRNPNLRISASPAVLPGGSKDPADPRNMDHHAAADALYVAPR